MVHGNEQLDDVNLDGEPTVSAGETAGEKAESDGVATPDSQAALPDLGDAVMGMYFIG